MRVCFSYAAYAKSLIHHLQSSDILIQHGLTDSEFSTIESLFGFKFPPDLRSILQVGFPAGHGFPNWRSTSKQQLEILINLPIIEICKQVTRDSGFWVDAWGDRPPDVDRAVQLAKGFLKSKAPVLVPIYRHFYIPARPCMAGNPIFYVHGGEIKVWSLDIAGFFQQVEFKSSNNVNVVSRRLTLSKLLDLPPWAATEARQIDFWTQAVSAENGEEKVARDGSCWWWKGELKGCLEEVLRKLRNGGWKEEEVREMMMMDGGDECEHWATRSSSVRADKEGVVWHVRLLSKRLLRAGWSREDVMDSLGIIDDFQKKKNEDGGGGEEIQKQMR